MVRNLIEKLERVALIGFTAGSLNACGEEPQRSQISTSTPSPNVTTERSRSQEESELEMLLRVAGRMSESLPVGTLMKVEDYGSQRQSARVVAQDGVKLRLLPDKNAPAATLVKWANYGQLISFRYAVVKETTVINETQGTARDELLERWLVLDDQYDNLVRWQCLDAFPVGRGRCFAAAHIGDETLISLTE